MKLRSFATILRSFMMLLRSGLARLAGGSMTLLIDVNYSCR
jgi:hypothetical protein